MLVKPGTLWVLSGRAPCWETTWKPGSSSVPTAPGHGPQQLVLQGKRAVSQNWVRRPLGPETLEDEEARAFCLGDRVELAVTMENKAKAKRIVSEKPPGVRNHGARAQNLSTQPASNSASARKAAGEPLSPGRGLAPGSRWSFPDVGWDYAQWKQEREQIDQERLARHRDAQGDWRRPWDLDKTASMPPHFSKSREDDVARAGSARGPRSSRKPQPSPSPPGGKGGTPRGGQSSRAVGAPAFRNKAWGMERLTGRARRWDMKEDKEPERQEGGQSSRNPSSEKARPQEQARPEGPELEPEVALNSELEPGSPTRPCLASPEGSTVEPATAPATVVLPSPPHTEPTPLDLSLGGARSFRSRESTSVLGSERGAQESPESWPQGSEQSLGWSCAQAAPEVQTCPEPPRGSHPPETREDSKGGDQQGLAPPSRPPRGAGQRTRGTGGGRSRAGGPGHARRC